MIPARFPGESERCYRLRVEDKFVEVFVVIKRGVYRHNIVGAFATEKASREAAAAAARKEPDGYHEFEICVCTVGVPGERLVSTCRRVDTKHYEEGKEIIDSTTIHFIDQHLRPLL